MRQFGVGAALLLAALPCAGGDRPAVGAPAPLPIVRDLRGNERPLKDLAGKRGLVLLFWAGWSERSLEALRRLDAAAPEMAAHGVSIAAVSVDRYTLDDADAPRLRDQVARLGVRVPVLMDRGFELFHAYGVVTIPSTAVVDANGRLAYFLFGYSHEEREQLFDAIDRLAGITRRPAPAEPLKAAPAAIRRLQLGRLQLAQRHADAARASFEVAREADETFPDPLVELAALALDDNDFVAAAELLDRAAALRADDAGVRRERARLVALQQRAGDAQAALEELTARGKPDAAAAAYLGFLLHAAGDDRRAEEAFDRAKDISGVDPRIYVVADSSPAGMAAQAMTAYRREVAAGRR